jgi:hypothetical protein
MGLKEQILSADDMPREPLEIPEWGVTVYVRTLTGRERDRFEGCWKRNPYVDIRAILAVMSVVEQDGKPVFTDQDIPALTAKSGRALDRILAVVKRLSGFSDDDIDELKKNSQAIPSVDSCSGSPSPST